MRNKRKFLIVGLLLPAVLLAVLEVQSAFARSVPQSTPYTYTYTAPPTATTSTATTTAATTTAETPVTTTPTPAPTTTPTNLISDLNTQLTSLFKQLIALLTVQLQSLQQQLAAKLGEQPASTTPTTSPAAVATTTAATPTTVANIPPRVNITYPYGGLELTAPASTDLTASALDTDGTISKVEFFEGTNSLGTHMGSKGPWSVRWSGINVGTYTLTAKVTDDKGAVATSAPVALKVKPLGQDSAAGFVDTPPTITIDGFGATATSSQSVSIVATASTYAGSISQVVFYKASSNTAGIIATDVASPFQVSTTMAVTGTWTLSATATNTQGSTKNSGSTTINIGPN